MKSHILHDFRASTQFKETSYDDFEGLHKLKLLTNFDLNLTSFPGGVTNYLVSVLLITPLGGDFISDVTDEGSCALEIFYRILLPFRFFFT